MKLSFHGAAGTVTGSRTLLSANGTRVLVDCGMFQGLKQLRLRNWQHPPFEPSEVDQVLLTHAHIDHSGYLPRLVRLGFHGKIRCTRGSADLVDLLLRDSAKIQEEDASYANRKGYSKHKPALPLYTSEDAGQALKLIQPERLGHWLDLKRDLRARYHNVGHILGAAMIEFRCGRKGHETRLIFSGDVGRYDVPLHADPSPRPECDVLVMESTYGDRRHDNLPLVDQLREPFQRTLSRGGVILIPAFAVGRSQLVTLILRDLMKAGELPEVPIHIDSPMAIDATRIYSRHLHDCILDEDLVAEGRSRLFPRKVQFHRTVAESKELNRLAGPRVIISASGMLTAGRVVHHLSQRLPHPENLILMAGYQAAGTRGRALLEGATSLKMHGRHIPVKAEFQSLHGLSSHADSDELMRWLNSAATMPRVIILNHGEPRAAAALAGRIAHETGVRCLVPRLGEEYDLDDLVG